MDNNNGKKGEGTIRARNKTVMLSPELAGQVRAKMASELAKNKPAVAVENQGGLHRPTIKSPVQETSAAQRSGSVSRPEAPTSIRRSSTPSSTSVITPPVARPRDAEPVKPYQQEVVYRDEPVRMQEPESPEPVVSGYDLQMEEVSGEHLKAESVKTDPASLKVTYTKKTKVIGFLVSYDNDVEGEFVVLRVGRLMVTSDAGSSAQDGSTGQWNVLVIPDDTVSGMHAIMKVQVGELHVLDQLSEHGTRIVKAGTTEVEELSQARGVAAHGDKIQFGKRTFVVCMVP
jgi:hypothetical protein